MRLTLLLVLSCLVWAAPVNAQKLIEQVSDQITVNRADHGGALETLARNSLMTLEYEGPGAMVEQIQIGASELYWMAPASKDQAIQYGAYAELRGNASVANSRLRITGQYAAMYPALGEFIWEGPLHFTPLTGAGYDKQLFDVSCAQGYLIINRVNVGRRTRFSPYAFENMLFWCEPGDRIGTSIRYQEP